MTLDEHLTVVTLEISLQELEIGDSRVRDWREKGICHRALGKLCMGDVHC